VVERWIIVGGLPVQHRLVQPSSQQVDADPAYLVDPEAKDLLVRRRPVEAAVRPDDVAVKRDAHRIGHAAHQSSSSVTGSTVRPSGAEELIAARGIPWASHCGRAAVLWQPPSSGLTPASTYQPSLTHKAPGHSRVPGSATRPLSTAGGKQGWRRGAVDSGSPLGHQTLPVFRLVI